MFRKIFFSVIAVIFCGIASATSWLSSGKSVASASTANINTETHLLCKKYPYLDPKMITLALKAYNHARAEGLDKKGILTTVDFDKASGKHRLTVIDLGHNKVLYHTLVGNGKKSGFKYSTHFSNQPGSLESSLGLYLTENSYYGSLGYAMRVKGLDKGFNDNAYQRSIVMHGAWYVNQEVANYYGRVGRSWGCFALPKHMVRAVINTVRNGTLIFAYYPNQNWISHSKYLK